MIRLFIARLFRKPQYIWRNKDYDIPIEYVGPAGIVNGVVYAEVIYEGRASYVPLKELVRV